MSEEIRQSEGNLLLSFFWSQLLERNTLNRLNRVLLSCAFSYVSLSLSFSPLHSVSIPLTTLENPDHVPQDLKEIMRNMSRKLPKDFENGSLTEDYVEEIKQELNDAAAEDDVESTTITLPYRDIEHYIEVMRVDAVNIMELVLYTLEFVIGTVGNSFALYKHLSHMKKGNKSRVNLLILHLIIADLMVMWLVVLIEIIWRYTVIWIMGDIMCRLLSAFKTFVMYLTSNLVVCVALDRYYALVKPLSFVHADRRNNFFLIISYILAAFCSIPQVIIFVIVVWCEVYSIWMHYPFQVFVFRLVTSQRLEGFKQCLTTGAFGTSEWLQNSYTITSIIIMFFIPLMIISYCYWKIFRRVDEAARPTFSLASDTAANSKTGTYPHITLHSYFPPRHQITRWSLMLISLFLTLKFF